jgi:hypothetical protein
MAGILTAGRAHLAAVAVEMTNNRNGFDLTSSGHLSIESSAIADHPLGASIVVHGRAAATVSNNQLTGSGLFCHDGAVVQSQGNTFNDAPIVCHDRGFVLSSSDAFQGKLLAAMASFNLGCLEVRSPTFDGFSGGFLICYDHAKASLSDASFSGSGEFGIQAADGSLIELTNVTVADVRGPCLAVASGARGFARSCRFLRSYSIGGEFANVGRFEVTASEFSGNQIAGAIFRGTGNVRIVRSKFEENEQAGADVTGGSPVFQQCEFNGNRIVGLSVGSDASAYVYDTRISESRQIGVSASGGNVIGERLTVSKCGAAALAAFNGGTIALGGTKVTETEVGCQATGAKARLVGTAFTNAATSVLAADGGVIQCEGCRFEQAAQTHCEARAGAVVHIEASDVGVAQSGIGLQVHDGGVLQLSATKVHHEGKFGIMVGDGMCRAVKAVVSECTAGGIYVREGATGDFDGCTIQGNGQMGMQIQGGNVRLADCQVRGHEYGIVVQQSAATFSETATKFENNAKKDLYFL